MSTLRLLLGPARLCAVVGILFAAPAVRSADVSPAVPSVAPVAPATLHLQVAGEPVSKAMARELASSQAQAQAELASIRARTAASAPSRGGPPSGKPLPSGDPCVRTVRRVDGRHDGQFTLQPGQNVLLTGCFDGAPVTEVVVTGVVNLIGDVPVRMQVVERTAEYVYARMPELSGVFDRPVTLQMRFADGTTSNSLSGQFRARRVVREFVTGDVSMVEVMRASGQGSAGVPVCRFEGCSGNAFYDPAGKVTTHGSPEAGRTAVHRLQLKGFKSGHRIVAVQMYATAGSVQAQSLDAESVVLLVGEALDPADNRYRATYWIRKLVIESPVGIGYW